MKRGAFLATSAAASLMPVLPKEPPPLEVVEIWGRILATDYERHKQYIRLLHERSPVDMRFRILLNGRVVAEG